MDVSTFSMPPSSSSWDTTSARNTTAADDPTHSAAATATNTPDETDAAQAEAARFTSPVIGVDPGTGSTILEYRNQSNGLVYSQVPSQAALQYAEAVASTPSARSIQQIEATGATSGGNVVA